MHLTTYSVSDSVSCIASEERNSGPGSEASSGTDNNFSANDSSLATATLGAKKYEHSVCVHKAEGQLGI